MLTDSNSMVGKDYTEFDASRGPEVGVAALEKAHDYLACH